MSDSAPSPPTIAPPARGLVRQWRRLRMSVGRRLRPFHPVVTRFDGDLRIAIRPGDRLGRRIYLQAYSDRPLATLLHLFLRPGMTYLDVGAHVGQYVLIAAHLVGRGGRVHALEPTGETFDQLRSNIELNGMDWITATRAVAWREPGELELTVCVRGKGEFNSLRSPLRPEREVTGTERVTAVTLDDYAARHDVDRVDFLKIDTEGAELPVLEGAVGLLAADPGPVIVLEVDDRTAGAFGYAAADLRRFLADRGYRLCAFDDERRRLVPEPDDRTYPRSVNLVAVRDVEAVERRLAAAGR